MTQTTTQAWNTEITRLTTAYPKFKARLYTDSRVWGWFKKHILKWAAATTVGYTVYFDASQYGTNRGAETLKHEGAHIADWKRWNVLMTFSYIFLLPAVFTMRAYWEWQGYKETLRSVHDEYKMTSASYYAYVTDYYCQFVADEFAGPNYLWMFPFRNYMYKKCQRFISTLS